MSSIADEGGRAVPRWIVPVAAAASAMPIVVAAVRAVATGWLAIGDNANFLIRSRDVLTGHHPLLGTWTSASLAIGVHIDNPGPLYFDLLAIPARVGGDAGLAVAVATLNVVCIGLIAWFVLRTAGPMAAAAAMAMTAALGWTMGSELLHDPWQPHGLLFSVLLFLVLVWSMLNGDTIALPAAVVVGSLIVQTHLSYAIVVPTLGAVGAAGLAGRWRQAEAGGRRRWRVVVASLVLGALCWAQPFAEQLWGPGPGNLGKIATNVGGSEATVGLPLASRITAEVLATPPFWARPSFAAAFASGPGPHPSDGTPNVAGLPSTATAAAGLVAVVVLAVIGAFVRRHRPAGRAAALVPILVGLAATTTAILPVTGFGVAPHQLRFLWPVAVFTTWALTLVAASLAGKPVAATVLALLVTVALAAANIAPWNAMAGPAADVAAAPVVRELRTDLHAAGLAELDTPVLFDLTGQRFAEPYTAPVMATLQELGVEFRVVDDGMVGQLGPNRRATGDERTRVFVREGDAAAATDGPERRVAFATAMSTRERRELGRLRRDAFLASEDRQRLTELEGRWARLTVAVFVAPRSS